MTDESFFVLPGDCPFVSRKTYQALLLTSGIIVVPSYIKKRGHPILIHKSLKEAILKEPMDTTLKDFRNRYDFITIEVEDSNILVDIDTQYDYEKYKNQGGPLDGY